MTKEQLEKKIFNLERMVARNERKISEKATQNKTLRKYIKKYSRKLKEQTSENMC